MSRDTYLKKLKERIDEINTLIDQWEEKSKQKETSLNITCHRHLFELRQRRDEARDRVQVIQNTGEAEWEDMKIETEQVLADLRARIEHAASQFN